MESELSQSEEERSLNLLCDIQRELANALNSLGGKQSRGALDNYYFYSADHVNRAAECFIFLRRSGRIDASKFLVRPAIETMFRVEAVQRKPELLYRIAYAETIVEDPKWIGSAAIRSAVTFDNAPHAKALESFKEQLQEQFPMLTMEDKYISLREIADVAGCAGYYDSHYRTYSRYAHGAMRAIGGFLTDLTDPEDNRAMGVCTWSLANALNSIGAQSPNLQTLRQRLEQQAKRATSG